jgi:outer membrane receptor for monomeric catechols
VLGSVAALGGGTTALAASDGSHTPARSVHAASAGSTSASGPADLTAGEQTVLAAVQKAVKDDTSSIATPIVDAAVSAGTITSAEATSLLTMLENSPGGPGPGGPGGPGGPHSGMGAPPTSS